MAPRKKKSEGPVVVRPEAAEDGSVRFVVGRLVPGEDEVAFEEDHSFDLSDEAALALAEDIPSAVAAARVAAGAKVAADGD